MHQEIRNLEPISLWNHFVDLNAIPRPSKKEEKIIQFMVDFGKSLALDTYVDKVGNVIIKKPATVGMENRKTVVLQSHLDMVHQKNATTTFDFETQGIQMFVDGDWVKAKGTTLGADNGIGVAAIMAILASKEIPHPPLEALFTIDEETGMTGAMGLENNLLKGEILLNLDTEEDDEIGIGCAGGIDVTATKTYQEIETSGNEIAYKINITGLQGGHSGMDIHRGLGNANKLMNRLLFSIKEVIEISTIDGGSLRNAIPRESFATIITSKNEMNFIEKQLSNEIHTIKKEFATLEPNLKIEFSNATLPSTKMSQKGTQQFIKTIYATHHGVYRMSPDVPNLVETSNNIARILVKNGKITVGCLARSSSESSKKDMANTLQSTFELADFKIEFSGEYPGWLPNMNSSILKVVHQSYKKLFEKEPHIAACHAGLECGILGKNYPSMEMISFGPNIKGAHSPDEKAQISSTQKFWKLLQEVLKNIPKK